MTPPYPRLNNGNAYISISHNFGDGATITEPFYHVEVEGAKGLREGVHQRIVGGRYPGRCSLGQSTCFDAFVEVRLPRTWAGARPAPTTPRQVVGILSVW